MMRSWAIVALFMAVIAVLLHAPDVWAMADDISVGSFSCSNGRATGQILVSGSSCPTTLSFDKLFSFLICNFEQLSSNLMGHMFCGMIADLTPAVWAAVSLAIAVFGVSFMIGLVPATGQEAMKFIIKLTFITAFATNADYLIGIGYRFLITAMSEGSTIVLATMNSSGIASGTDLYAEVDKMFATFMKFATDAASATKSADFCKNAVFAVIALLLFILPIAAYIAIALIGKIILTLFRVVFAYIYALIGIVFLLALSPFFLSFYLFKISTSLFDRWLAYLVSFTLQVILLFAFLTFIVLLANGVKENNALKGISTIIMHNEEAPTGTAITAVLSYCTLCDFKMVDTSGNTIQPTKQVNGQTVNNPDYNTGTLRCKDNPPKPITPNHASSPDAFTGGNGGNAATPGKLSNESQVYALLTFSSYGLIPLLILVLVIDSMLTLLPSLAQKLAGGLGATYAPQLGGGQAGTGGPALRLPGESYIDNFGAGFSAGFNDPRNSDTATKTGRGLQEAFSSMVTGRYTAGKNRSGEDVVVETRNADGTAGGMRNSLGRWMSDPSRFGQ